MQGQGIEGQQSLIQSLLKVPCLLPQEGGQSVVKSLKVVLFNSIGMKWKVVRRKGRAHFYTLSSPEWSNQGG